MNPTIALRAYAAGRATFGFVDVKGKRYGECNEDIIRRYLLLKRLAWQRDGVPFHVWLTSPACEVLDVTWAMNLGTSRTRDECARRIFYKLPDAPHSDSPTYHPTIVGEDFLYRTGCIIELDQKKPS